MSVCAPKRFRLPVASGREVRPFSVDRRKLGIYQMHVSEVLGQHYPNYMTSPHTDQYLTTTLTSATSVTPLSAFLPPDYQTPATSVTDCPTGRTAGSSTPATSASSYQTACAMDSFRRSVCPDSGWQPAVLSHTSASGTDQTGQMNESPISAMTSPVSQMGQREAAGSFRV